MLTKVKKIITDYRTIISYQSYYFFGFKELTGQKILFSDLDISINNHEDYRRGSAWIVEFTDGKSKKLYIDTNDRNDINERFYDWCDLYCKINLNLEDINRSKVFAIGPSFGIRVWNLIPTLFYGTKNWLKWQKGHKESFQNYMRDYGYTIVRRLPYYNYCIECNEDFNYIFTLHTLWYDEDTFSSTNRLRGVFAKACKDVFEQFEGGFFYIDSPSVVKQFPKYKQYLEEYKDILTTKRITMKKYLSCTQRSSFVFNTPSVCGCHGWKLGEYLAMGKAIISTPLNNVMPGCFENGRHYIEVKSDSEIVNAVHMLHDNPKIIFDLKQHCKEYFNQYLAPSVVIERILNKLRDS